jgi:hypothetical protein
MIVILKFMPKELNGAISMTAAHQIASNLQVTCGDCDDY